MADTAVAITAGTGTNIDTRTESTNGNHRQVIVIGDPTTNAGVAPVDATNGLAVDVKQSALPTGASTGAKQDTGNASLATIAGAVSGTEMQVDVLTMPTTTVQATNLDIRDLSSLSDSVEVKQATGTNLHVVVDTAPTTAVTGTFWQATQPVSASSLPLPTGASTSAKQDDIVTAINAIPSTTQYTEGDVDATITGTASLVEGAGNALAVLTQPLTDTQLRATAVPVSGTVTANTGLTQPLTDTQLRATAVPVSGTFWQTTQPVSLASAVAVTDNSGSLTVDAPVATPVFVRLSDGAAAITTLPVSLASVPSHAVTNAGTFAVQSTNQANSGVDIGDVTINNATGASAVNIQDGGNSITVDYATTGSGTATGALRVELPTNGTGTVGLNAGTNAIGKLAANDGVDIGDVTINNASGSAVFVRHDQNGLTSERVTNTDGTSTAFSTFTNTASTYNYINAITVYNSSASAGYVDFRDGTGGSVLWTMPLPAGGGSVIALDKPLFRTSANTALAYDVSGALSTVYISVSGFRSTT